MGLGPTVYAVSWTELAVVSILFAARLYVNAFILRRFRADFWWATATYVRYSTTLYPAATMLMLILSPDYCHCFPSLPCPLRALGSRNAHRRPPRFPDCKESVLSMGIYNTRYNCDCPRQAHNHHLHLAIRENRRKESPGMDPLYHRRLDYIGQHGYHSYTVDTMLADSEDLGRYGLWELRWSCHQ
jgi:hypothetical protein